jgi:hypothetical protein
MKKKDYKEWHCEIPEEIKNEAVKFKLKILSVAVIAVIIMSFICGCITKRGNSIGGGYIKGPDGVYRKPKTERLSLPDLPPVTLPDLPPVEVTPPQSKPVKLKPVKTRPTIPKGDSAVANPSPVKAKSSPEKLPPFSPTTPLKKEINLGLIKITLPDGEKNNTNNNIENSVNATEVSKEEPKQDYSRLFAYYFFCSLFLLMGWMAYKYRNRKKPNDRRRRKGN